MLRYSVFFGFIIQDIFMSQKKFFQSFLIAQLDTLILVHPRDVHGQGAPVLADRGAQVARDAANVDVLGLNVVRHVLPVGAVILTAATCPQHRHLIAIHLSFYQVVQF